ncbi:uncharacterized protein N7515_007865 [Penicillium bovifimosum]|uniref:Amino acid permease/ SLC12A domain-containing protein n=1 Tax=Penicillium bovifimosum TaxID=126998 RepID=A0A9W9GLU5_9EURO|nr:uncharacterized protein N7515_007865 [Penicillium bovifimosum]KAJ5124040.1 hypothetical protein N7515_007865 [Penicillium bovifimosum]
MAVGPTIGTGLLIGAGQALAVGGPASLFLSYIVLSFLTFAMTTSLAEVSTHMPSRHGTLITNGYLYLSNSVGFAASYFRWYTLSLFVPYEITSAMVNLGLWKSDAKVAIRMCLITAIVVGTNFLPEKTFKRSEGLFTSIKIGTMASLFVISLALGLGGVNEQTPWGFKYWKHPGAMNEYIVHGAFGRFLAFIQCLLDGSIAFTFAPELIVHRAEMPVSLDAPASLSAAIPGRVTADVFTTAFPYIMSSLAMSAMAPSNDTRLTNNGTGSGFSPYVIGLKDAQIQVVPMIATIGILLSSVASGRSFLYLSSRSLCAMSELGHAPSFFSTRNRWDVPYVAVISSALVSAVAFASVRITSPVTNTYLLRLITSAGSVSSLVSCAVYHQFNQQLKANGITKRYGFSLQPYGTYFGVFFNTLSLLVGGLWAGPKGNLIGSQGARLAVSYLNVVVFGLLYLGHRLQYFQPVVEIERPTDMNGQEHWDSDGPRELRAQKTDPHRKNLDTIPESPEDIELQPSQTMFTDV